MLFMSKQVSLPKISSIPGAKNENRPKKWYVADITWLHVDTKFIFECSTQNLAHSLHSLVRCRVEHEKIKFISTSGHVIHCLYLYKHTNDDILDDFPKISEDFPKWFWRKDELFQTFFRHFPKITKDFWRRPKISEERPMMFQLYSNTSKYFLMDYVTIAMVIILVTMAVTSCDSCCPIGCQIRHVLGILCKGLQ